MAAPIRESRVEHYLRRKVIARDGLCLKFVSPALRDVPDRIVMLPSSRCPCCGRGALAFVEVKRPGKEPTDGQYRAMGRLIFAGQYATYANSFESVESLIDVLETPGRLPLI